MKKPPKDPPSSKDGYVVGPGRPPKETRFKKGQSGNKAGRPPNPPSILGELVQLVDDVMSEKVSYTKGKESSRMTLLRAGLTRLALDFAKGDKHARRDFIALLKVLKISFADLTDRALPVLSNDDARRLIERYISKHNTKGYSSIIAPDDLSDDDPREN